MDDYQAGDPLGFNSSEVAVMKEFEGWYLNWWGKNYPPGKETQGPFVFLGSAGRGLVFLRKYLVEGKVNETLLDIAEAYISISVETLPRRQTSGSYMYGHNGVWFLMSVIADVKADNETRDHYKSLIFDSYQDMNAAILSNASASDGISLADCTLDTGLSGMLYGSLLYNRYYGQGFLPSEYIVNLVQHILNSGMETGNKLKTDYLQYESFTDCYLWGPGHGSSGAIRTIFTAYNEYPTQLAQIMTPGTAYYVAIKNTIDFYLSIQLADGNIPTNIAGGCAASYGTDNDSRVQWCHGAPGFVNVFLEAAVLFNSTAAADAQKYLDAGVKTATVTWERGLLVKGTMFCHGIAGNINMLHEAYHHLARIGSPLAPTMAYRAKQFTLWTLSWQNINATRLTLSNEGYSMYQGNYAIPMLYTHTARAEWPETEDSCQPGWNLCI
eukprot:TRINITY_DN18749_c0_g2_i1.p1 TRINITY_DN18749_c0_g2~~TRINITY_DN18749_c0_g2_i1.p1  ORF type:complete len:506 (+),score=92.06 TRINITY_DN18749_c0_g2_i1:201-1520(+)